MLKDYGFKEIEGNDFALGDVPCLICCYITDENAPVEIINKVEEMIDATLKRFEVENHKPAVLEETSLVPRIQVYCDTNNVPIYFINTLIYVEDMDGLETDYEVTTSDSLYMPFKQYMLKQLEKSLFR